MNTQPETVEYDEKVIALASFLDIDPGEIEEGYDSNNFEADGCEYMVLTDSEADEMAREYIEQLLWAFNPSFLSGETGLPEEMFSALQDKCEGANDAFLQVIEQSCGLDSFVETAIGVDGRGHFLNTYDGEENEQGEFFIYRTN